MSGPAHRRAIASAKRAIYAARGALSTWAATFAGPPGWERLPYRDGAGWSCELRWGRLTRTGRFVGRTVALDPDDEVGDVEIDRRTTRGKALSIHVDRLVSHVDGSESVWTTPAPLSEDWGSAWYALAGALVVDDRDESHPSRAWRPIAISLHVVALARAVDPRSSERTRKRLLLAREKAASAARQAIARERLRVRGVALRASLDAPRMIGVARPVFRATSRAPTRAEITAAAKSQRTMRAKLARLRRLATKRT